MKITFFELLGMIKDDNLKDCFSPLYKTIKID